MTQDQARSSASDPGGSPTRAQWITLFVMSMALMIVIIDVTIVNVTIPAMQFDFGATLQSVEWVSALYALVYAALIITFGKLGDTYGRRRLFNLGLGIFVAGSLLVGAAPSISWVLMGRFVQALGAAMVSPATLSIVSTTFRGRSRGVAFGIWGGTAAAAGAIGPLLGGFLTTFISWRWAFLINLPIGILAVVGSLRYVPESLDMTSRRQVDVPGIALASLGLGSVVFGLIEGQTYGWWAPRHTFTLGGLSWPLKTMAITPVMFVIGVAGMAGFVLYELKRGRSGLEPLFDFSLLRFKGFRYGLMTVLIVALGEFGLFFVMTIYLQIGRGLTAFQAGLVFLPFAVANLIVAPMAGWLSSRIGPKWVVTSGMLLEAISIFSTAQLIRPETAISTFIPTFVLYGMGVGLTISQLTNTTLSDIPPEKSGVGSGANNTVRQVGAAIGVAILGAVLANQISSTAQSELARNTTLPPAVKAQVSQAFEGGLSGEKPQLPPGVAETPVGQSVGMIFDDAISAGVRRAAETASIFVLLGALSSLLIPNRKEPAWGGKRSPEAAAGN
jgi:EmrB/QacA subfamily drug resistance transporter